MSDTPFPLPEDGVASRLTAAFDADAKIPRALEALGPVAGRDVVLVDADHGYRVRQLVGLGARVTALVPPFDPTDPGATPPKPRRRSGHPAPLPDTAVPGTPAPPPRRRSTRFATDPRVAALRSAVADLGDDVRVVVGDAVATGLPDASADVVVALWSAFRAPAEEAVAEADRILRPGGRLLVVHDYGRDDHVRVEPAIVDETVAWSRRDGWYLTHGFRVRVIHAFWTFDDLDEAHELLAAAFGEAGGRLAEGLTRPRISHNVAVYHRDRGGRESATERPHGSGASDAVPGSPRRQPAAPRPAAGRPREPGPVDRPDAAR